MSLSNPHSSKHIGSSSSKRKIISQFCLLVIGIFIGRVSIPNIDISESKCKQEQEQSAVIEEDNGIVEKELLLE